MRDARLLLIFDTGLDFDAAMVLACLATRPDQRIVHQQPCPPDDDGHIVAPEAVFFERGPNPLGLKLRGGLRTFRRLLKGGWLTIKIADHGEMGARITYWLSFAAEARFDDHPAWQAAEDLYRDVAKLPPRLRVVA